MKNINVDFVQRFKVIFAVSPELLEESINEFIESLNPDKVFEVHYVDTVISNAGLTAVFEYFEEVHCV